MTTIPTGSISPTSPPGAGGRSLYNFGTPLPGSAVRYNGDYGTMIIDATETNLTFEFHSINPNDGVGGLIDSYTIGEPSSTFNLTTNTVGGGSITLDPLGGVYEAGTPVTVTAVPDQDWTFVQWSGDLSGSVNPETIVMNGNRSVTAIFSNGDEVAVCDDLESGYTLGQELSLHPDWFYEAGQFRAHSAGGHRCGGFDWPDHWHRRLHLGGPPVRLERPHPDRRLVRNGFPDQRRRRLRRRPHRLVHFRLRTTRPT